MGKIISFEERRLLRSLQGELKYSIAYALEAGRKTSPDYGSVRPYSSLTDWLKEAISGEIITRKQISEEVILCGLYIAGMLAQVDCDLSKYAVDFLERWADSSDPEFLKMGGDFCFVLCGGFYARSRKMMRITDYQKLGAGFYDWFYSSTGKVIGHYMSANFTLMQDIVNSVLTPGARPSAG